MVLGKRELDNKRKNKKNKISNTEDVSCTKDLTETVPGNGKNAQDDGNDKEEVLVETINDSVIPMGTGTKNKNDRFEDF